MHHLEELVQFRATARGCVAVAIVDLASESIVFIDAVEPEAGAVRTNVPVAAARLFQRAEDNDLQKAFGRRDGNRIASSEGEGTSRSLEDPRFGEIVLVAESMTHVFVRFRGDRTKALALVTRETANLGSLLAGARTLVAGIEKSAARSPRTEQAARPSSPATDGNDPAAPALGGGR